MSAIAVVVDAHAPAERLAAFRVITGVFATAYLLVRLPVFLELAHRSADRFDGVGVFSAVGSPAPANVVTLTVALTVAAGCGYSAGLCFRWSAPTFAFGMLLLTSYRGSWGQLLHFENLIVIHLLIVAASPAADVWSVDHRRASRRSRPTPTRAATAYGWPLALAGLVVVLSYMIAAIAKLRYGGVEWVVGDTLRNHVAYSAARLDLLGGNPSPIASAAVRIAWMFPPMAAVALVVELAAPLAFVRGSLRTVWVLTAWAMHAGIFALMLVGFPYPLFGVAFAPFYRLERLAGIGCRSCEATARSSTASV